MKKEISRYHHNQSAEDNKICCKLYDIINSELTEAESKLWHRHPVWFIEGNPIVGYSKLKDCIRLMFWSGADFEEETLLPGSGKFKDASIRYTSLSQINQEDIIRWIQKSRIIQWDYKNIYKRKGKLIKIK